VQNSGAGVAISLVLHALAAVVLARVAWNVTTPAVPAAASVVWLGEWAPAPLPGAQQGRDEVDSEPGSTSDSAEEPPTPDPVQGERPTNVTDGPSRDAPPAPEQPASSTSPRPAIDWSEARRRAIEDALAEHQRGASYRSFSFSGTIAQEQALEQAERQAAISAGLEPPKTVFDSPSKGRAGLGDTNPFGQYVVWITDDCYQTYGAGNPFLVASVRGLFAAPTTACVPVQARNDLFENLKPRYLMSLGEITDRAERLQRADRPGRTETGAVAWFDD
jgi:hypothetical protein